MCMNVVYVYLIYCFNEKVLVMIFFFNMS